MTLARAVASFESCACSTRCVPTVSSPAGCAAYATGILPFRPMLLSSIDTSPSTGPTTSLNHRSVRSAPAHPDAPRQVSLTPVQGDLQRDRQRDRGIGTQRDPRSSTRRDSGQGEPPLGGSFQHLPLDDQAILSVLVRLRLLSFRQVHELLFRDHHPTLTRRRLRALRDAGWLVLRDGPRKQRRGIRLALPSRRTLAAVLPRLAAETASTPHSGLVRVMLPPTSARPLDFADGTAPKWLRHQIEVNHLVTRIATSGRVIRWASSWDAPLPTTAGITFPQPDYILVEEIAGATHIVFGEHDRGWEPVERFIARKLECYSDLAAFPEITTEWFGTTPFSVHVSVIDATGKKAPLQRLKMLLDAAALSTRPDLFRFTLGGWLFAHPDEPVFFAAGEAPTHDSLHWQHHATARA